MDATAPVYRMRRRSPTSSAFRLVPCKTLMSVRMERAKDQLAVEREPHTAMTDWWQITSRFAAVPVTGSFFQAYVHRVQAVGHVCTYLRWKRKSPVPSSAAFGKIGDAYVTAVSHFAGSQHIPAVHFRKGEQKEETDRSI